MYLKMWFGKWQTFRFGFNLLSCILWLISVTIDRVLTGLHNSNDTNFSVCTGSTLNRYHVIIPSTDWCYLYVSALAPPCDHVGWLSAKPAGKWPAQYGSRHNDSSKNIWWVSATKWMDNQRSPAEGYQWSIEVNMTDWPAWHTRALCWVEYYFANKKFASLGYLNYSQFTNEWCCKYTCPMRMITNTFFYCAICFRKSITLLKPHVCARWWLKICCRALGKSSPGLWHC